MEAKVYNLNKDQLETITVPEALFDYPWKSDLVYQVVTAMQANRRSGTAHTKDRSEVSGGGKKPWRQKGTGRARHGSNRSPIWVGGGVTHGPRKDKKYDKVINRKMKIRALLAVLSAKWRENEIIFVDQLAWPEPKTKSASELLIKLSNHLSAPALNYKVGNRALVITPELDQMTIKSFNNLPQVATGLTGDLNPLDLLRYKYLIITEPEKSLEILTKRAKV